MEIIECILWCWLSAGVGAFIGYIACGLLSQNRIEEDPDK